ncbi:TonB-linked outer membrane protein, SusC/RagA family [Chitinophaga rupis]|uniref:TonB-linked outer membrane protein, SusC/RagA family n=1 Tax=Chitinophaga rupis TaxID=573321 RepID=A0A1H7S8Y1_9BACT|nr:TonB-dependent receptor [Chitinophaga rupis]SEL68759.1 TonB-linked outer membrane protein, SusC/RagA family [Chitinophaga rupis]
MKLTVLLMTITLLQVHAAGYAQTVTLSQRNISLDQAFKEIRKQTGYAFLYTDEQLQHLPKVSLELKNASLQTALDACFQGQPLTYSISDKVIIIKRKALQAPAEIVPPDQEIKGRITNEKGEPLPGVTVQLKGTTRGVVTNENGEYSITVPAGNAILIVSSIGYNKEEIPVSGKNEVSVTLQPSASNMNELVVVGYGEQKRGALTNSITSVSAAAFKDQPVNRLDQVLQGRAAGVQVTNAAGSPGGSVRIRIRGSNSINGDNGPLYVVDGFVGAEFFSINPDDIESIQVLKDASATALFGSRGSNGVIIITTKKGSKGGLKVNFTSRYSSATVIKKLDLLNAGDFAETANAHAAAVGTTKPFTDAQVADYRAKGGTNWQNEVFRTAPSQEYLLSLSGGNDKSSYFISGNYLDQDGVINNSFYKRYTVRSNINANLAKGISTFLNITGSYSSAQNVDIPADGPSSPLAQAITWSPTVPVRQANGSYTVSDPVGSLFYNPVALTTDRLAVTERMLANMIGGFRFELLPGLSYNLQYGVNYLDYDNKSFAGKVTNGGTATSSYRSNKEIRLQNTNTLNYRRLFNNVHSLDVTAVAEYQQSTYNYVSAGASNLTYENFQWNNLALGTPGSPGSGYSKWGLFSLIGRVNYGYKDKYLVSGAFRRDGSSKFQGNSKYGYFPSVSAGWVISNEPFMQDVPVLSTLKLRGSWGLTGNQGINPYSTFSSYSNRIASFTNSTFLNGIVLGNIGNPDLKWETTEQKNAGLDVGLFNNRVNLTADYFVKETRDLLLNETLPLYLGGNTITRNVGTVQNKGWELSVDAAVIDKGAVNWNTSLNVSLIKNKVIYIGAGKKMIFDPNTRKIGGGMSPQSEFVVMPGQPLGAIWGLTYLGTWKPGDAKAAEYGAKAGDSRYQDLNSDGLIDANDYGVIGTGIPRTSIGWNNTVTYKSFTLNLMFQGLFGFDKLNYNKAAAMYYGGDAREATLTEIKDRYIPGVNETSDIPAFSTTNRNFTQSTRFLEKADFLRLKNVSLSYDIPKSRIKNVLGVKVFVSATNLLTFTGYSGIDPEANSDAGDLRQGIDFGSYPNAKTITGGVTLSF